MIIQKKQLESILKGRNSQPHRLLGMHACTRRGKKGLVVRAFLPDADTCEVIDLQSELEHRYRLKKAGSVALFEGFISGHSKPFRYRLRVQKKNREVRQFFDPYSFSPLIAEEDLRQFNEGDDPRVYEKLGCRVREVDGVPGAAFAVWAPAAKRVSVVGDFNGWDGLCHPMRLLGVSGVWEIFIPGLGDGEKYKYEILGATGVARLKSDPYASFYESSPYNASIIHSLDRYSWQDRKWMQARRKIDWKNRPISIYEVHLGSWKRIFEEGNRPLSYLEIAEELVAYVKRMGFTHVEFLPLAEHPFSGSWGYQVTGFFAPTHRFGTPGELMGLIDILHCNEIGVIIDWVPAHFPRDTFALHRFDGGCLYEHADPMKGEHPDWDTLVFDYGRPEVRCFLGGSALAWLDRYHVDGLRVDAVASMLYLDYSRGKGEWAPNKYGGNENLEAVDFLRQTNELVHRHYPGTLMIAEESGAWPGVTRAVSKEGLGFDLKWNLGWMHDTLQYFQKDKKLRKKNQKELTFGIIYQFSENFVQVFSHDEVVHGKSSMINKMAAKSMSGKAAQLRALYALMWAWPGKKSLFMGSEFGQTSEWKYDSSLQWNLLRYKDHEGVQRIVADLNRLYISSTVLHRGDFDPEGFKWICFDDVESAVIAFLRQGKTDMDTLAVVGHYSNETRLNYRVGVSCKGYWREVINSDSDEYGGGGVGNMDAVRAESTPYNGHPYSLSLTLPPHSTLILKYEKKTTDN